MGRRYTNSSSDTHSAAASNVDAKVRTWFGRSLSWRRPRKRQVPLHASKDSSTIMPSPPLGCSFISSSIRVVSLSCSLTSMTCTSALAPSAATANIQQRLDRWYRSAASTDSSSGYFHLSSGNSGRNLYGSSTGVKMSPSVRWCRLSSRQIQWRDLSTRVMCARTLSGRSLTRKKFLLMTTKGSRASSKWPASLASRYGLTMPSRTASSRCTSGRFETGAPFTCRASNTINWTRRVVWLRTSSPSSNVDPRAAKSVGKWSEGTKEKE
mmetsp:Transcript_4435/g.14366  ORF Transcript_4435/g.14366 Transcript_4435/m.14366 type:complete len:267 (-) Transcript_4435:263-1063(-)